MWTGCILTATYLINRLPFSMLNETSLYEMIYKKTPTLSYLRVFGYLCFATIVKNHDKFGSRFKKCVMMGYSNYKKGYRLYSLDRHQFIFLRDVKFFEFVFPFKDSASAEKEADTSNSDSSHSPVPNRDMNTIDFSDNISGNDAQNNDNIFAAHDEQVTTLEDNINSKGNLDQNPNVSTQVKYGLEKYKVRLVAQSFGQKERIDYEETFSLVVKMSDKGVFLALLVYVNDIIITGNNVFEIENFEVYLKSKFMIKDLGKLKYFLSIEVINTDKEAKHSLSKSSTKAEYRALASVTSEVIWILKILKGLNINNLLPVSLHCDSNSAIKITANLVFHERIKHLEIDLHFVREKVLNGVVKTVKIYSANQIVDISTKGFDTMQHNFLVEKLGMFDIYHVKTNGEVLKDIIVEGLFLPFVDSSPLDQGSNNDVNVLRQSPVLNDLKVGKAPEVPFVVNNVTYKWGYFLTDGIYPEWVVLIKSISQPGSNDVKRIRYKQAHEAARKDVE
ncbi:ribonuclease H-like domain-containing protein [Tanacetum coccineum]